MRRLARLARFLTWLAPAPKPHSRTLTNLTNCTISAATPMNPRLRDFLRRPFQALLFAGLAGMAAGCAKPPAPLPKAEADTVRPTPSGGVIGTHAENGVHVWRAIPYAAPPVGALRWRAPRPALAWEGQREAVLPGARCPQLTNGFNRAEGKKPGMLLGQEDCLTLDIYAPKDALSKGALLPVMVWIHGGSNVWGGADQYDASRLAADQNVIVAVVQYRLGVLGYFAHPLIRNAADTDETSAPEDKAANFGILDLVQSLRWVRDNIGAFGGDPARVTIFGESAGGHNVAALLVAPQARGLFQRAIIQSGSFDSATLADAEGAKAEMRDLRNSAHDVAYALKADSAEALRAAPLDKLYAALELDGLGYLDVPTIIEDGVTIPEGGPRAAVATPGAFATVSVMTGTNKDEMKLFQLLDPRLVNTRFGVLITAKDQDFYDANSDYMSRVWRIRSVDGPAASMAAAGHADVYAYRFDWDDGGKFLTTDTGKLIGAAHAMEIPFVFHRFQLFGPLDPTVFAKKTAADREALAAAMGAYWASFARDGAPSAPGAPAWPKWSDNGGTLLRLDTAAGGGVEPMAGVDSMERLIADLKADPRLDDAERCLIARGAAEWNPGVSAAIIAGLGICS